MARFRTNALFAMAGNLSATASLAIILVVIARLGSPELVGQFSYSLAICTPLFQLALLRLRDFSATEGSATYSVRDFLTVSIFTNLSALLAVTVLAAVACPDWQTVQLCFFLGLWRSSRAFSEVVYGYHQRQGDMRRCAISQIIRSILTIVVFVIAFWLSRNLCLSIGLLAPANLLLFLLLDFPTLGSENRYSDAQQSPTTTKRMAAIIRTALPLGLGGAVFALNMVVPRALLEQYFSFREVGLFASVAFLARFGTPAMRAVGQTASSQLAKAVERGDRKRFEKLLFRVTGMSLAVGLILLGASWFAGAALLTLLYGPEYTVDTAAIMLTMCYATMIYMSTVLTYGMIAGRRLKTQFAIICLTVVTVFVSGHLLIPEYGIVGACLSLVISAFVRLVATCLVIGSISTSIFSNARDEPTSSANIPLAKETISHAQST